MNGGVSFVLHSILVLFKYYRLVSTDLGHLGVGDDQLVAVAAACVLVRVGQGQLTAGVTGGVPLGVEGRLVDAAVVLVVQGGLQGPDGCVQTGAGLVDAVRAGGAGDDTDVVGDLLVVGLIPDELHLADEPHGGVLALGLQAGGAGGRDGADGYQPLGTLQPVAELGAHLLVGVTAVPVQGGLGGEVGRGAVVLDLSGHGVGLDHGEGGGVLVACVLVVGLGVEHLVAVVVELDVSVHAGGVVADGA